MNARGAPRKMLEGGPFASATKGPNIPAKGGSPLLDDFIAWETARHIGDLASIAGLLLSIVGFAVTILGVRSSRRAAQRAEAAAKAAVLRVRAFDELMNLTAAITTLDEIRRYHRVEQWTLLPDRYTSLRRTLLLVKSSGLPLTDNQSDALRDALVTLSDLERMLDRGILKPERLDGAKLNARLAPHLDSLLILLAELKADFTDRPNGQD